MYGRVRILLGEACSRVENGASGQYTFFMTYTRTQQLTALMERSVVVAASEPDARQAIEHAVAELVATLRNHHTGTADHSNRLAVDCRLVGEELDLEPDVVVELELVAILHDIGKLAVPAAILDLARPLRGRERAVVRSHTIRGAQILAEIAGLRHLAPLVRASHERWDGTGYPDGLAGEAIPFGARVVAVCDAYSAMRQARRYGPSLSAPRARAELLRCAGTQFDPRLARAFCAMRA